MILHLGSAGAMAEIDGLRKSKLVGSEKENMNAHVYPKPQRGSIRCVYVGNQTATWHQHDCCVRTQFLCLHLKMSNLSESRHIPCIIVVDDTMYGTVQCPKLNDSWNYIEYGVFFTIYLSVFMSTGTQPSV